MKLLLTLTILYFFNYMICIFSIQTSVIQQPSAHQLYYSTKMMLRMSLLPKATKYILMHKIFLLKNALNFQTVQGISLNLQVQLWTFLSHQGVHRKVLMWNLCFGCYQNVKVQCETVLSSIPSSLLLLGGGRSAAIVLPHGQILAEKMLGGLLSRLLLMVLPESQHWEDWTMWLRAFPSLLLKTSERCRAHWLSGKPTPLWDVSMRRTAFFYLHFEPVMF